MMKFEEYMEAAERQLPQAGRELSNDDARLVLEIAKRYERLADLALRRLGLSMGVRL